MVVLVLTQWLDPTADHVISELNSRKTQVFRLDMSEFPVKLSVTSELDERGWITTLQRAGSSLCLGEVTGIYYRRPTGFMFPAEMSENDRRWSASEARMGIGGILSSMECWLNHPARIAAAEYKPVQLSVATSVGLRVPRTRITNDPAQAAEFAARTEKVIYKPLSGSTLLDGGQFIYTSVVQRERLPDEAVGLTMHMFQEWIDHDYAVRMTFVDGQVFASAIYTSSDSSYIDWRSDYSSLRYAITSTPGQVETMVSEMMRRFGLRFGALDFLVTAAGEWIFLEVNPNGQWAWIEDQTGLPIAAAISDALTGVTR